MHWGIYQYCCSSVTCRTDTEILQQSDSYAMPWIRLLVISLSLWGLGFNPRPVHAGFVADCQWQEVFLWGPHFSPVSIILPVLYTHQHQTLLRTGSTLTKWFKENNSSHVEIIWITFVLFYLWKWRHETTQRHNTTVSKQLGNLCDSSNIFFSVLLWETQIFIEASSDIISIQSICRDTTWNQESF